jgi:hypothetical protein
LYLGALLPPADLTPLPRVPVPSQTPAPTTFWASYTIPPGNNTYLDSVLQEVLANGWNAVVSFAAGGNYQLLREHTVVTQLVLTGASASGGAVVLTPSHTNTRHFYVSGAGANLTLVSLTVADGYLTDPPDDPGLGGAVYLGIDTVGRFANVTFCNNTLLSPSNPLSTKPSGGAIYATQVLSLTLLYCQFIKNHVLDVTGWAYGGAVMVSDPKSLVMSYCNFQGNFVRVTGGYEAPEAWGGAVILTLSESSASSVTLQSCSFSRNQVLLQTTGSSAFNAQGGAFYVRDAGSGLIVTFYRCTFSSNVASISVSSNSTSPITAYGFGGALFAENVGVRIDSSVFSNNTAIISTPNSPSEAYVYAYGGAAHLSESSLRVTGGSRFVGNKAVSFHVARGGALDVANSEPTSFVSGAVFQANLALASGSGTLAAYGGAVHDASPTALFVNSSFTSNGVIVRGAGPDNSNSGTGQGGALHIMGSGLTFVRCNVTSNYVRGKEGSTGILVEVMGGGISADCSSCILTLNRTMLTNNSVVHWGDNGRAKGGGAYIRAGNLYAYGGTTFRRNVATGTEGGLGGAVCGDHRNAVKSFLGLYDVVVVPYSGDDTTTAYNSVFNSAPAKVVQPTPVRYDGQKDRCELERQP